MEFDRGNLVDGFDAQHNHHRKNRKKNKNPHCSTLFDRDEKGHSSQVLVDYKNNRDSSKELNTQFEPQSYYIYEVIIQGTVKSIRDGVEQCEFQWELFVEIIFYLLHIGSKFPFVTAESLR
jgi:hypothetical protein